MRITWLAGLVLLAGCPDVSKGPSGTPLPTAEFDPLHEIVPFPNNLAIDPTTHRVTLPAQACENDTAKAIRTNVLNQLDGFGTYEVTMTTTLTEPPDPATVQASNVVMYKYAQDGNLLNGQGAQPVPIIPVPTTTLRFDPANCSSPAMVDTIAVLPMVTLDQHASYIVAVKTGIKTMNGGQPFMPSAYWSLARQATDPVTLDANGNVVAENTPLDPTDPTDLDGDGVPDSIAQLRGIDQLWQVHAPGLQFLDQTGAISSRNDVLVAWTFTTQTTTDPLDPAVAGSPAAAVANASPSKLAAVVSLVKASGAPNAATFLAGALPAGACNSLPCTAVGDVMVGPLVSPSYQVLGPNPLSGGGPVPGAWSDPVHPAVQSSTQLVYSIMVIPTGTPPASGWPTVVFGHGLGSAKETLLVFAPRLAQLGFASIAIDFQASGQRAVKTSNDPAAGCAGTCSTSGTACTDARNILGQCALGQTCCPAGEACRTGGSSPVTISPTTTQSCYAPLLSLDIGATRDNMRQSVLDLQSVVRAVKACGPAGCPSDNGTVMSVDPAHVLYAGISLGGILGSTTSAVVDFKSSLLNAAAVGWLDILENTATADIKCPLVNAFIDLGFVTGPKWDPANPTVGLCINNSDWTGQPGYKQLAVILRWALDPADGANYMPKLKPKKFLLQEVLGDAVVSNVGTLHEGLLLGQSATVADPYNPLAGPLAPSAAITTNLTSSKWVQYSTLPASDAATGGFGNAFAHSSLLRPASVTPGHCIGNPATTCMLDTDCNAGGGGQCIFAGALGTARIDVDALTFLGANK